MMDDEAEADRQHMLKGMYPGMKELLQSSSHLSRKYPSFPSFWQDLSSWSSLKAMQKVYLVVCERREKGIPESEIDVEDIDRDLAANASAAVTGDSEEAGEVKETMEREGNNGGASGQSNLYAPRPDSKWEPVRADGLPNIPGISMPAELPEELQHEISKLHSQLDNVETKIGSVPEDAKRIEQDPNRPPSPPPTYDAWGKRTNTREMRMKEELERERVDIMARLVKIDVAFKPAQAVLGTKPTAKVFVPVADFPHYNFIGLILGPRGNTQRRLEGETGCKISIRGKGSVKEGSRGRNTKTVEAAEAEALHVVITGETRENVNLAVKKVEELLQVKEDTDNTHKQSQLRELALINGTLREDEFCSLCGEKGHRQYECPHRNRGPQLTTNIRCSICGELSHPTGDCPLKHRSGDNGEIDTQYQNFMAELDGGGKAEQEQWQPNKQARVDPNSSAESQSQESLMNISRSAGRGRSILPAWMTEKKEGVAESSQQPVTVAAPTPVPASSNAYASQIEQQHQQWQQQYTTQSQYGMQQQYVDPKYYQTYNQGYGGDPQQAYGYYDQQAYDASYAQQQGYDYSAYQNQQAYYGNAYPQYQQYSSEGQGQAPPPPPPPPADK